MLRMIKVLIILAAKYHTTPLCSTRNILFGWVLECNTVNHVSQTLTQTSARIFDILSNLPQTKSDIHPVRHWQTCGWCNAGDLLFSVCARAQSALIIRVSTIAVHYMVYIFVLSLSKISLHSSKTLSFIRLRIASCHPQNPPCLSVSPCAA